MSSDYLGVIFKYEKDRESCAVEKSRFTTSQSGGIKTERKSSKLFELTQASLKSRLVFLLYALKSSEIGQSAHVEPGLFHGGHIQHFSGHEVQDSRSEKHTFRCHATAASLTEIQRNRTFRVPGPQYLTDHLSLVDSQTESNPSKIVAHQMSADSQNYFLGFIKNLK